MSFEAAMSASGLVPRIVTPDGKWRRCATTDKPKKRNGAYILYPDGRGYWRNWATDGELNSWRDNDTSHAKPIDFAAIERQRNAERQARIAAIRGAREAWAKAGPMRGLHPYLEKKGLSALGCTGLRQSGDLLVIPVYFGDRITSLQTINPDGEKRFWKGAPVKGGAYVLRREKSALTAFCEGFATGLAIYQSVKHATVVIAFDAGNLVHVVDRLRPVGSVVICADDDHGTQAKRGFNPGKEKAQSAADLIGAGVAWPEGIEGTDFADMLKELGRMAARKIERLILSRAKYVTG